MFKAFPSDLELKNKPKMLYIGVTLFPTEPSAK